MIASGCLLLLMAMATITDVWRQKIYNWTTYSGIVIALLLNLLATTMEREEIAEVGIQNSLFGFLACGAVMLICFALFQIGGGDVKLLAMVGAFLGVQQGIEALLWTMVIGGAMAVVILIWKVGAVQLLKRVFQQLRNRVQVGEFGPLEEDEKTQLQVPLFLAPSALLAVLIVKFSIVDRLFT